MKDLEHVFSQFYEKIRPQKPLEKLAMVDPKITANFHANYKTEMAKVFMHINEFVALPYEDKVFVI